MIIDHELLNVGQANSPRSTEVTAPGFLDYCCNSDWISPNAVFFLDDGITKVIVREAMCFAKTA